MAIIGLANNFLKGPEAWFTGGNLTRGTINLTKSMAEALIGSSKEEVIAPVLWTAHDGHQDFLLTKHSSTLL